MYTLRPYQADSVKAVIHYFRKHSTPAVIVLPTGAGKSLVIAELARLAKGRVLVMAHVKELVEQNHAKYEGYDLKGSVFSAGLGRKETDQQVVFASVQSVVRNLDAFKNQFSLLVIDECHRVPDDKNSSYQKVITHLRELNPGIKVLGLTATPYRLGMGWIYQYHTRGQVRTEEPRFFRDCIFELPIRYLLDENFLTPARMMDAPVLSYDFSQLKPANTGRYKEAEMDMVIDKAKRATPQIVEQIIQYAKDRHGVMIFAATVRHAQEIHGLLPEGQTAIVIGDTPTPERDAIIQAFKNREIKYLVNVSVLTTGFDAPHVDLIAILRPTESVSLYQQIVGRGLRLSEGKSECLVLDYAGNSYDLYQPEVGDSKPDSTSEIITIPCPACGFNNNFWGKLDSNGFLLEHFGRRCQGYFEDEDTGEREHCGYRFRAKYCGECGADNDIAARICHECDATLVDPDKKLKEALNLKDALIFECTEMDLSVFKSNDGKSQLKVTYSGEPYQGEGNALVHEFWSLTTKKQKQNFKDQFVRPHLADKHRPFEEASPTRVVANQHRFRLPQFVIARKSGRFWKLRDKIFDDELK
ncbi:DEAD/DEAH box helicase [Vibrio natriegens]|uniref:ATP-dependent helicase n=2 Tax=Vibrio natriegens TaxID=691 RepID=A0AAN0Y1M6_VIBNA|nr:DEAD/DEAH box helicase [Vibrio natriegens]ALR15841.1 carboxylate--amine ligase [Vibrio natriegens NBRC 15636 = ATCC 14048 = DSM 759]ANQ12300.1 ATP-dependent helicase [Vibrio natriegens NBRC 15636 = ATCC 14048 = DSM 759]EPM42786.1 carboxylate--amine ligase [Vibrio natriegens NBRC 15636 = ATCC 14048 = DSM 759]MDX6026677.1 DEAD/DEAH box helicase [Vibrio natriegens NBRC 15636 = ATCC 14048 = DSM 759]UUI12764.1 DEAD/DEAH box helicase [Vibrio natriegens]